MHKMAPLSHPYRLTVQSGHCHARLVLPHGLFGPIEVERLYAHRGLRGCAAAPLTATWCYHLRVRVWVFAEASGTACYLRNTSSNVIRPQTNCCLVSDLEYATVSSHATTDCCECIMWPRSSLTSHTVSEPSTYLLSGKRFRNS
jgi:hypothetical protein